MVHVVYYWWPKGIFSAGMDRRKQLICPWLAPASSNKHNLQKNPPRFLNGSRICANNCHVGMIIHFFQRLVVIGSMSLPWNNCRYYVTIGLKALSVRDRFDHFTSHLCIMKNAPKLLFGQLYHRTFNRVGRNFAFGAANGIILLLWYISGKSHHVRYNCILLLKNMNIHRATNAIEDQCITR